MIDHLVFDMDGVLADTQEVVRAAYRALDVEMPDDAFGKPWREWLPRLVGDPERAAIIHIQKNVKYIELLRETRLEKLPAAKIAFHRLIRYGRPSYVLTGASLAATHAVLDAIGLGMLPIAGVSVTQEEKKRILGHIRTRGGVYVDDQPFVAPRGWRVVQYNGQTKQELEKEIWTP